MTMRQRLPRAARKERQWGIVQSTQTLTAATQAAGLIFNLVSGLETALSVNAHNWTASALRMRINMTRIGTSPTSANVGFHYGVSWFNNDAIAAGPVSLPDPVVDNADWMAYGARVLSSETAVIGSEYSAAAPEVVHNNSMRKQRENNSSLVLVLRSFLLDSASVTVRVHGRVLYLLP